MICREVISDEVLSNIDFFLYDYRSPKQSELSIFISPSDEEEENWETKTQK